MATAVAAALTSQRTLFSYVGGQMLSPCGPSGDIASNPLGWLPGENPWAEVRDDIGVVVKLRHMSTKPGTSNPPASCSPTNHSTPPFPAGGREEARLPGAMFRARNRPAITVPEGHAERTVDVWVAPDRVIL